MWPTLGMLFNGNGQPPPPSDFVVEAVEVDGGLRRQDEVAGADVEEAAGDEDPDRALDLVALPEVGGGGGEFAHQLVPRPDFRVQLEDLAHHPRLVIDVTLVGRDQSASDFAALSLVVHGS